MALNVSIDDKIEVRASSTEAGVMTLGEIKEFIDYLENDLQVAPETSLNIGLTYGKPVISVKAEAVNYKSWEEI